ncbi:MAG: preprotein translocase subunit SecG [Pseudomonadota bacterium]
MNTMTIVLMIAHFFICVGIIVLVLMQRGKGADAGASFGAGASGTVFGARGSANFLSRATAVLAAAFFANSLALAYLATQGSGGSSIVDQVTLPADAEDAADATVDDALDELPSIEEAVDAGADAAAEAVDELPEIDAEDLPGDAVDSDETAADNEE